MQRVIITTYHDVDDAVADALRDDLTTDTGERRRRVDAPRVHAGASGADVERHDRARSGRPVDEPDEHA